MAITKAQQYKQMLRDGGVTEDIGFSIAKPSKDGLRPGYRRSNYGPSGGGLRDSSKDKGSPGPDRDNTPSSRRGGQGPYSKPTSTKPKAPPGRPAVGTFLSPPTVKPKDKPDIIKPKPKPPKKTSFRDLFRGIFPTTTSVVNTINQSGVV